MQAIGCSGNDGNCLVYFLVSFFLFVEWVEGGFRWWGLGVFLFGKWVKLGFGD